MVFKGESKSLDKLVDGMLQTRMVKDTADLMQKAAESDIQTSILINNRAGGNAPLIAPKIAKEDLAKSRSIAGSQGKEKCMATSP